MRIDFLIVGQGLAGSLLAWELMRRNCKVVVVDSGQENASQVAAGIINPITGQRFVKSTEIDVLLPAAKACYAAISDFFHQEIFLEKTMLRLFRSDAESKIGLKRLQNPDYNAYLSDSLVSENTLHDVITPFGALLQKQTGHLLTTVLLDYLRDYFIAQGCYRRVQFNYQELRTHPVLGWQDIFPQRVIFCEGYQVAKNPWFSWLPLQPVKGEILTLHSNTQLPNKILNYGDWLLPLENQGFRIGATFDREVINTVPTVHGRTTLINNLNTISPRLASPTLTRHQANIRPCTADRQPFMGYHPQHPQLCLFNGFGAKGSLQIPWFSQHFVDSLLAGKSLAKTCNIERYAASHYLA